MSDNETRTQMFNIRFTPAELAALRSVADERSCSVGAVVRWAVRRTLYDKIAHAESEAKAVAHTNGPQP